MIKCIHGGLTCKMSTVVPLLGDRFHLHFMSLEHYNKLKIL